MNEGLGSLVFFLVSLSGDRTPITVKQPARDRAHDRVRHRHQEKHAPVKGLRRRIVRAGQANGTGVNDRRNVKTRRPNANRAQ